MGGSTSWSSSRADRCYAWVVHLLDHRTWTPPENMRSPGAIAAIVMFVPVLAAAIGLIGAAVARLFGSSSAPPA